MITIRPSQERGHFNHGWLDTYHTFSFGDYRDPKHIGFHQLRVINEDWIAPGAGFEMHPHRDMEIITYMVSGSLAHVDSMGNASTIHRGQMQRMTAGRGIMHGEFNPSGDQPAHLLQIWIRPASRGLEPGYEQRALSVEGTGKGLWLLVSRDGRDGTAVIHQDVDIYRGCLTTGQSATLRLESGRSAWLQVISGAVTLNGQQAAYGDGMAVEGVDRLEVAAATEAEFLLFDLA